jgi:hypothetical protein
MIIESTVLKPPSSDRETFLDNELEALRFPNAMYRNCTLCERSYTDSNHPVIVKGISGCHCVLGHACLTRHMENSNTCPVQICQKILYRPEGSLRSEEQTCLVTGQCSRILKKIEHNVRTIGERLDWRSAIASQLVAEAEAGPPDGDFTSYEDMSPSEEEQESLDETESATGELEDLEETTTGEPTSNEDLDDVKETTQVRRHCSMILPMQRTLTIHSRP